MTDKKLKVNSAAYTELSIQIAVLEAKVDKLLELAIQNEQRNKGSIFFPSVNFPKQTAVAECSGEASAQYDVWECK